MTTPADGGRRPVERVEDLRELNTPEEIAEFFRVSALIMRKWLRSDQFPNAFKIAGRWRIPRQDVLDLAQSLYGKK